MREENKQDIAVKKPAQLMTEVGGSGPILTWGGDVVTGTGQTLRANRFTPAPLQNVLGSRVRY